MLFVIAMRDIREGEELLAEYGEAASLSLTRLLSDALSVFSCAHAYLLCFASGGEQRRRFTHCFFSGFL